MNVQNKMERIRTIIQFDIVSNGLSVDEVAEKIGITPSTLLSWINNGNRTIRFESAVKVARAYGYQTCDAMYLSQDFPLKQTTQVLDQQPEPPLD